MQFKNCTYNVVDKSLLVFSFLSAIYLCIFHFFYIFLLLPNVLLILSECVTSSYCLSEVQKRFLFLLEKRKSLALLDAGGMILCRMMNMNMRRQFKYKGKVLAC